VHRSVRQSAARGPASSKVRRPGGTVSLGAEPERDMAFDSLGEFVAALRRAGELAEVGALVDPHLEISEITDRVVKAGGPALLFTAVKGSAYPVLTNQFGSERRMALAFGASSIEEVAQRVRNAVKLGFPTSLDARIAKVFSVGSAAFALPRTVKHGAPVHEVVEHDVDLTKLPVLTTWPLDGGPFVTLPLVFTKDPESGLQNVGMYRMQRYDRSSMGMHWQKHKQGRAHAVKWGRYVPVAVAIGADPAITYSATAPLPPIVDEISLAGFLRGRAVRMVKCQTIDIKVPADAEFVLEGYVDNEDLRVEGPFGDHTGVYSLADYYPTFHVTCVTHRRNPIYAATVVGKPPMEDAWLGKTTERIFLPLLQMVVPEIVDYNLPVEGGFHNLCIVSVKKTYPGQAKKVMNALWGLGHMLMLTRCIIVVDHDVDVHDTRAVTWFALNNADPSRDLVIMPGPVDDLDHSGSYLVSVGHKLGIDATRKRADEGYERTWPPDIVMDTATRNLVTARWQEYGLRRFATKADAYSGQGTTALETLLARLPFQAGSVDATALRAKGVPALGGSDSHER
jgi:4-hydroxy-3-polyprenylbenzoate decarboxylase